MIKRDRTYYALPGRAKRGFGLFRPTAQRLWVGADHFLAVSTVFYIERYKRFYFQDIQALTITRTTSGMILNLVLGILALLFGVWAGLAYFAFAWPAEAVAILGIVAFVWVVTLLLNALFGPTCRCLLYTAVQCEELFCLGRLRTARRVERRLRSLVESAQGGALTVDDMDAVAAQQSEPAPARAEKTAGSVAKPLRYESGTIHAALFFMLFLDAAICAATLVWTGLLPGPVALLYLFLVVLLTVAALVRQHNSTLPSKLRSVTWATFVYLCLIVGALYIFTVITTMGTSMGEDRPPSFDEVQTILDRVLKSISILFDLLLGTTGLWFLREYRRAAAGTAPRSRESAAETPVEP